MQVEVDELLSGSHIFRKVLKNVKLPWEIAGRNVKDVGDSLDVDLNIKSDPFYTVKFEYRGDQSDKCCHLSLTRATKVEQ